MFRSRSGRASKLGWGEIAAILRAQAGTPRALSERARSPARPRPETDSPQADPSAEALALFGNGVVRGPSTDERTDSVGGDRRWLAPSHGNPKRKRLNSLYRNRLAQPGP